MDLGLPIIVAHMIVFWYSQDANGLAVAPKLK